MWIRGFKEKWWKKVLGSLQQQPPLSREDVGRRDPGVNVRKFRWGQTRGRLKLKHCELCLKARSVLKMAKQMSSFCGGGESKKALWANGGRGRDVIFCFLRHGHMSFEESMCDYFFFFFFWERGIFWWWKTRSTSPEAHAMFFFFFFLTFLWWTNRLGGADGFTACFLLAVSWPGVLWWTWLLSMLLCLSRDHCVFRGRVRGGAVGGNLGPERRLSLNSEFWKWSSCTMLPLVQWLCPAVSSFLICWCRGCCWCDVAASSRYLAAPAFSLTTSVTDCATVLSSPLLPDSQNPSFDCVMCTSPVAAETPLSYWLWVWGCAPLFSLFKDFFDRCGLRGTILATSECELPVLL